MLALRGSRPEDAHYLIDIDIKCFEFPWSPAQWRRASADCMACVVTWKDTPVGMAVFRKNHLGDVEIVKLGVKKPFRKLGVSRALILNCAIYAREVASPFLVLIVPERRLCPGDPEDLSAWLTRLGFRARTPLYKDYFKFYGEREDGVMFYLPIPFE